MTTGLRSFGFATLFFSALVAAGPAGATAKHHVPRPYFSLVDASAPQTSIAVDWATGRVLEAHEADVAIHPASLTKMMTLYLTFEAMQEGRLGFDQTLPVSEHAASQPPTKLGLRPGQLVPVRDLVLGIITRSANDAAVVLAEGLGGTEGGFAALMTQKAHDLGMTRTVFVNASGLPDDAQRTTARDLVTLAMALYRDFPQQYPLFATERYDFDGVVVTGHNRLMARFKGMDGLKTGYIRASGFNLASSAERDGHRIFAVVIGGRTAARRDALMARILDRTFPEIDPAFVPQGVRHVRIVRPKRRVARHPAQTHAASRATIPPG